MRPNIPVQCHTKKHSTKEATSIYNLSCMRTHQETPQPRRDCQLKKQCQVQPTIQ